MAKKIKIKHSVISKSTVKINESSENLHSIWLFDRIDRDGKFAFNPSRPDFMHKEFLEKMIAYSSMTWAQIRLQTHDNGKSKHHFLNDVSRFSKHAQERITFLNLYEYTDSIFSFALRNRLRIIGIREKEFFHVLWYDPQHEFYPVSK